MRKLLFAAVFLLPTAAAAEGYDVEGMQAGLSMLELNVARILNETGVDADPRSLDLSQIVQIISLANEEDAVRAASVRKIIADG